MVVKPASRMPDAEVWANIARDLTVVVHSPIWVCARFGVDGSEPRPSKRSRRAIRRRDWASRCDDRRDWTCSDAGGNVMDAAVTASLCVGVAEPYGSGLGGKLMLLYRDGKTGEISAIEAMCAAPGSLEAAKFAKLRQRERYFGYTSVAVPGLVAGLHAAHEKWGSRPWKELVLPAAELAERGVTIDEKSRRFLSSEGPAVETRSGSRHGCIWSTARRRRSAR